MNQRMTALERAFQLARSGQVSTVSEIKTSLARDGYSINQLDGPSLRRQLAGLISASRLDDTKAHGAKLNHELAGEFANVGSPIATPATLIDNNYHFTSTPAVDFGPQVRVIGSCVRAREQESVFN